jgi:hypothetical protein
LRDDVFEHGGVGRAQRDRGRRQKRLDDDQETRGLSALSLHHSASWPMISKDANPTLSLRGSECRLLDSRHDFSILCKYSLSFYRPWNSRNFPLGSCRRPASQALE